MLHVLLGVAGSGKSSYLLQQISSRAKAGRQSLLLVPEQFSSSAETLVYRQLGDELGAFVQIVSFRTLAQRILQSAGSAGLQLLSDAGRTVFVRRALDILGSKVRTYARHRRNTAFCGMCADTIDELKTAGATPDVLRQIAAEQQEPKFEELALIYEAYEAALQNLALDSQDMLTLAAKAATAEFFEGFCCFIDDFDGFTAPEYALLRQMVALCEEMTVALCCDALAETEGGIGLFSPVRKTAQRLIGLAQKQGVPVKAPVVMQGQLRCKQSGPAAVNWLLATGQLPQEAGCDGLALTPAPDEWEEVKTAAAQMHWLAGQGVPYKSMALVCRDIAHYQSCVRYAFGLYNIPYFTDAPTTVEHTAPVAFVRAAFRLLREGLTTRAVVELLKTGLCGYSQQQLAALENYVYTWEPTLAQWREPFDKNPAGLMQQMDTHAEQQLQLAESLRADFVPILQNFLQKTRSRPASAVCRNIYLLLDKMGGPGHADDVIARLQQQGALDYADKSRRAWDTTMALLDQMHTLLGEEKLTAAECDEIFLLLVRSTDFGQVPQALECVLFTSADRMRLSSPEYCFVVGLCEGEFPSQVGYSGLLTHADRDLLVAHGVDMPGGFNNRILLEQMFLYRALTAPSQGLFLSWPQKRNGELKTLTSALHAVQAQLAPPPLELAEQTGAATSQAAFARLAQEYRQNNAEAATLYAALQCDEKADTAYRLNLLTLVDNNGLCRVQNKAQLQALLGNSLTLSATKAEKYYECRFAYFMERVLNIKPLRKAVFSPLESGQFVHYVLEHVLREAGGQFAQMTDEELEALANEYSARFIADNLPDLQCRTTHLLKKIQASTAKLLCHMRNAASQSDFEVDALELPLTDEPDGVPPLEVELADGKTVRVTGKIDRVDVLHKEGKTYLSIVDYKTGSKSFDLNEVYCGLNMQMLIYMHTLLKNGGQRYPNAQPAAVLYLASDPPPLTGPRDGQGQPLYRMDGLVIQDETIAQALDNSKSGVFIPVKYNKNGTLRSSNQLASLQKMGHIQTHVEEMLRQMAQGVYGGQFDAKPLVKGNTRPCTYCAYQAACRHEAGENETAVDAPQHVFEEEEA